MQFLSRIFIVGILIIFGSSPVLANSTLDLLNATETGDVQSVKTLLKKGVFVDARSEKGYTPLLFAALNGHKDLAQLFVDQGADVNAQAKDHWTPLLSAAAMGHTPVIKVLLHHGADMKTQLATGDRALYLAAQNGHRPAVAVLLANQAQVDAQRQDGMSPLFVAVQNNHIEVVQELLGHGVTVDLPRKEGTTPLYLSAQKGHTKIVELLLAQGANHQFVWKLGWTPLLIAAETGQGKVVHTLLAHGAKMTHTGTSGETALFLAAKNGHTNVVRILIREGAEVNSAIQKGLTPLMMASLEGHETTVTELLASGADVHLETPEGINALFAAKTSAIADLLKDAGATLMTKESSEQISPRSLQVIDGTIEEGVYRNARIGWELAVPSGWAHLSPEELQKYLLIGQRIIGESLELSEDDVPEIPLLNMRKDARTFFISMAQALEDETESIAELANEDYSSILEIYAQQPVHFSHERFQEEIGAQSWEGLSINIYASADKETLVGKQFYYYGLLNKYAVLIHFTTADPVDGETVLQAWRSSTFAKAKS